MTPARLTAIAVIVVGHHRDVTLLDVDRGASLGNCVRQLIFVDESAIVGALEVRNGEQVKPLPKARQREDRDQKRSNEPKCGAQRRRGNGRKPRQVR